MWAGNFKTAISYLRLYKWRSFLTMMGIIVGISSVVTIVSLGEGLKNQVVGQVNLLGDNVLTVRSGNIPKTRSPTSLRSLNYLSFTNSSTLTKDDVDVINNLPSVNAVAPLDFLTNSVRADSIEVNSAYVIGTSPNLLNLIHQKVQYGNFLDNNPSDQNTVVIGHDLAMQLFNETNAVGETLSIMGQNFIVRGILTQASGGLSAVGQIDYNSTAFIPIDQAKSLANSQTNIVEIFAQAKDSSNLQAATSDIKQALLSTHGGQLDFTILKKSELLSLLGSIVNTITGFISAIAAISLVVGGIGIMDIMLVSISERTREIGVRKAIGATNRQILNQFLTEGLVLTLVGGLIGVVVSLIIDGFLRLYTELHPSINVWILLLAVGVSVFIGIIFSVIPALKAARKDPITALRGD